MKPREPVAEEPVAKSTAPEPAPPLVDLRALTVRFRTEHGVVQALGGVDLAIQAGEVVVLAGESGSGKTILTHAILRLLPRNAEVGGQVLLDGTDLLVLPERRLRAVRGRRIALIPQSAGTALDPVKRLGGQLLEWAGRRELTADDARPRLDARLRGTGLSFAAVARRYAHQLSGGMQQRVVNAGSLVSTPDLVIADEPTHGLDADFADATAGQLLDVVAAGSALLVITHDLRLAEQLGGRLALLYASHLVEPRPTAAFFTRPTHPYGRALLGALIERGGVPIPGLTPELTALPPGCPFARAAPRPSTSAATPCLPCIRSTTGRSGASGMLTAERVTKVFDGPDGRITVLDGATLSLAPGARLGLVGPSGCGKSTLTAVLALLLAPDHGRVVLDGVPVTGHELAVPKQVRRRVQLVWQLPRQAADPRLTLQ